MLGFAVQNSIVQATLGLVIVHPVYLYKQFYRTENTTSVRKTNLLILCKELWLFIAGKILNVYRYCVRIMQSHR